MVEEYFESDFYPSMAKNAKGFLRTIPIQKSIDTTQNIAAYEDASEILKKMKTVKTSSTYYK